MRDLVGWQRWRYMVVWRRWRGWVGVGLIPPLAQRWVLPLLLLVKEVDVVS
jgi:hypothetical protein